MIVKMDAPGPWTLVYVSLGAGVQSTALMAMAVLGLKGCPKAKHIIFSDTGAEPEYVYKHVEVLKAWCEAHGATLHVVKYGSIPEHIRMRVDGERRRCPAIPAFVKKPPLQAVVLRRVDLFADQTIYVRSMSQAKRRVKWTEDVHKAKRYPSRDAALKVIDNLAVFYNELTKPEDVSLPSSRGQLMRTCTEDYKIVPIQRKIRELMGIARWHKSRKERALALIGISTDEVIRMKPAKVPYAANCYPLIDAGMSRDDCITFIREVGLPVPHKSSCLFCPYHSDAYWEFLRVDQPEEFQKAVEFDEYIRNRLPGVRGEVYLHGSLKPLKMLPFVRADGGAPSDKSRAGEECTGHCHN